MVDAQHHSNDEMAAALNLALAEGDIHQLMDTLGRMARAHRMRRLAQQTGLGEKSLYKSMRAGAKPEVGTVLKVSRPKLPKPSPPDYIEAMPNGRRPELEPV